MRVVVCDAPPPQRLRTVVLGINGIIEHRIERNLKLVSMTVLVSFPESGTVTTDDFFREVEAFCRAQTLVIQTKNVEVESAVDDLLSIVSHYPIDKDLFALSDDAARSVKRHYARFMYLVRATHFVSWAQCL